MNSTFDKITKFLPYVSLVVAILGMFISSATLSIGMIGIGLSFILSKEYRFLWNQFVSEPALWLLSLYFVLILLSGLYSDNMDWLFNRLLLKLPFLVLPISILAIPHLKTRTYYFILSLFFYVVLAFSLSILVWYAGNYDMMNSAYREGTVLPTPVMHIRYSMMVVYSLFLGVYLYQKKYYVIWHGERYIYLFGSIILFIFAHILAVRTGVLSLYVVLILLCLIYIWKHRKFIVGGMGLILLVGLGYIAINHIPTLSSKVKYTLYSIQQIKDNKDIGRLSDSYRLASIQAGIAVGNTSPFIGVGIGDLKDETAAYVKEHYPEIAHIQYTPQNQFVHTYAALGIIGLIVFTVMVFFPFTLSGIHDNVQLMAFHTIAITSFLVEQTLESQLGIAYYLLFSVLGTKWWMDKRRHVQTD